MRSPGRTGPYVKLLVGGLLAWLLWVSLPEVPQGQTLRVHLGSASADVRYLRVDWHGIANGQVGGFELFFEAGAPRVVVRDVTLPNGDYRFETQLGLLGGSADRTRTMRRVTLGGGRVTLRLEALIP